jgi:pimeloyl-ACP methyl ester carboxylesterase
MSFPYLGETKELNDETRKGAASGAFVQLPDGITHYELGGPEDGQPVVLVHGFSTPYFIFDPTFEFLKESGFRVLRYDLFGRGWSDRPKLPYNIHLFVKQLADLLDALEIKQPIALAGLSMGGPISTAFIDRYPERVSRQILIDPAGARSIALTRLLTTALIPGVGELIIGVFGSGNMVKSVASDFFDPALIEHFQARYKVQMQFYGFKRSILSTMRNGMLASFYDYYQRVGCLKKRTLLFWGHNDHTVPFGHSKDILAAIPHAEFHIIEDCGHIPHYEKPQVVNPILLEFLSK